MTSIADLKFEKVARSSGNVVPSQADAGDRGTSSSRQGDGLARQHTASFSAMRMVAASALAALFLWSYWPTWIELIDIWQRIADYSHGFLVAPMSLAILWLRRGSRPALAPQLAAGGLLLIALSLAMRFAGLRLFLSPLDGWSMILWLAGAIWLLAGAATLRWSLPAVAFLVFLVPLPYRIESAFSLPLQGIATQVSCWLLQVLGQPAIAEGHNVLLAEYRLHIDQTCSGLRMMTAIVALGCAWMAVLRPPAWQGALLAALLPAIAIATNALRIAGTGLLYVYVCSTPAERQWAHDATGWVVLPLAALFLVASTSLLNRLFIEAEHFAPVELAHVDDGLPAPIHD